jgi:hypothetical protein
MTNKLPAHLRRRIVGSELLAAKLKAIATNRPQLVMPKIVKG